MQICSLHVLLYLWIFDELPSQIIFCKYVFNRKLNMLFLQFLKIFSLIRPILHTTGLSVLTAPSDWQHSDLWINEDNNTSSAEQCTDPTFTSGKMIYYVIWVIWVVKATARTSCTPLIETNLLVKKRLFRTWNSFFNTIGFVYVLTSKV